MSALSVCEELIEALESVRPYVRNKAASFDQRPQDHAALARMDAVIAKAKGLTGLGIAPADVLLDALCQMRDHPLCPVQVGVIGDAAIAKARETARHVSTMASAPWAKLFDTSRGQLLATIEHSEEDDTFSLKLRMDTRPGSASVAIAPGGWGSVDPACEALCKLDVAEAEHFAGLLANLSDEFLSDKVSA